MALISCAASRALCSLLRFGLWPSLVMNACISFAVPNIFFLTVYARMPLFRESVVHMKNVLLKRR